MEKGFSKFRQEQRRWYEKEFGLTPLQWGSPKAKLVIIGQAPSRQGQQSIRPFSDKTGEKMRREWFKISDETFYNQNLFYLTALGLIFPGKEKHGGDKRPDVKRTGKWLKKELTFISPKLFLILGRMAAEFFFPKKSFEELIFGDQELFGRKALVLPHPSPLNIKWFKDHPRFLSERLLIVRREVHKFLK